MSIHFSRYWAIFVLSVFGLLVLFNILYVAFTNRFPPYAVNVDGEGNVAVLLSVVIYVSLLMPIVTILIRECRHGKRIAVLVGLVLSILSVLAITIDEVLTFHEFVVTPFVGRNFLCPVFNVCTAGRLWVILYLPLGILVAICLLNLFRALDPKKETRGMMFMGVAAFLFVMALEVAEVLWTPYLNFLQEFVEIFGAMMFFRIFTHLAYGQH